MIAVVPHLTAHFNFVFVSSHIAISSECLSSSVNEDNEQGGALQPAPRFGFRPLTCHLLFRASECAEWGRVHGL
jgi:hypothetical protein